MKIRVSRTIILLIGAAIVMTILAVISIPKQVYVQLVSSSLGNAFKDAGIVIDLEGVSSSGLTLSSQKADILFTDSFITLQLTDANLSLSPTALLALRLDLGLTARAYGGSVSGNSRIGLFHSSSSSTAQGNSIRLEQIPVLSFLGFTSGVLSFEMPELQIEEGDITKLKLHFETKDLEKGQDTPLIPQLSNIIRSWGLPLTNSIPPFEKVQLRGSAVLENEQLSLEEVTLNTDVGEAQARGIVVFLPELSAVAHVNGTLKIRLSQKGLSTFGDLLPLFSKGSVKANTPEFSISLQGPPRQGTIKFSVP
jgi:hypothetical protein